jgi:hypothetical protein
MDTGGTEAMRYRWPNQYGPEQNTEESKRTQESEGNARLKRLLAYQVLVNDIVKWRRRLVEP